MTRLVLAFKAFFQILFSGTLASEVQEALGIRRARPVAAKPVASETAMDGALQILSVLQRDARLIDFLMEDISGYGDEQVGAAVRNVHQQSRESLGRYVELTPVIDGVEGTVTTVSDPAGVKFLGNVQAGKPKGGILRHKGWRAVKTDLPPRPAGQDAKIVAPAEIEIE